MKQKVSQNVCGGKGKKSKSITSWDKDVICLPRHYLKDNNYIPYPRGKCRAELARNGLVGKVHLTTLMTVDEVSNEIRSTFESAMFGDYSFPFKYLQGTGGGIRGLTIPSVSSTFEWTAQQVAKLGNQRNTIYILAEKDLKISPDKVKIHHI